MANQQTAAQRMIGDFAPKLVELTDEVLFGDIWERPGLSKRDRDHHPENHHRAGGRVAEDLSLTPRQHGEHDGKESRRCRARAWEARA
jgi:hypothetical protein